MNMLLRLLTLPLSAPIETALWAAKKISERAEDVYYDETTVQAALLELELRLELGEIDEESFEAEESQLLTHLKEIREYKLQRAKGDV